MKKVDMLGVEEVMDTVVNQNESITESKLRELYPNKEMFSTGEVALMIGMSYDFVAEQIRKRKIPAVRFGDRPMVSIKVLCKILNEGVSNGLN